jgi:hypothetical protein
MSHSDCRKSKVMKILKEVRGKITYSLQRNKLIPLDLSANNASKIVSKIF